MPFHLKCLIKQILGSRNCEWKEHIRAYLMEQRATWYESLSMLGYKNFGTIDEAIEACSKVPLKYCGGVTHQIYHPASPDITGYSPRVGPIVHLDDIGNTVNKENSYVRHSCKEAGSTSKFN